VDRLSGGWQVVSGGEGRLAGALLRC